MISNNPCQKLSTGRIFCDWKKHDIRSMRNANLRKTYIPFSLSETDTQNMSVIEIFYDFQIYTKADGVLSVIVKLENWTIHLITDRLLPITFFKAEVKMKIALKYSSVMKTHEGKLNYET